MVNSQEESYPSIKIYFSCPNTQAKKEVHLYAKNIKLIQKSCGFSFFFFPIMPCIDAISYLYIKARLSAENISVRYKCCYQGISATA